LRYREPLTIWGFSNTGFEKMCDREGVASVEIARVFCPDEAKWRAVAAAQVVLPTPPFPENMVTVAFEESDFFLVGDIAHTSQSTLIFYTIISPAEKRTVVVSFVWD
jgi:hypothetical protein